MMLQYFGLGMASKHFFIGVKPFHQCVNIRPESFGGFWQHIPQFGAGFMEPSNLLSEFADPFFVQPSGHTIHYPDRVIENNPGVGFFMLVAVGIYPVVFQQGFGQ